MESSNNWLDILIFPATTNNHFLMEWLFLFITVFIDQSQLLHLCKYFNRTETIFKNQLNNGSKLKTILI